LWLAIVLPFRVLFDPKLAARVQRAGEGRPEFPPAEPEPKAVAAPPEVEAEPVPAEPDGAAALQLLAIFQREGRFIDFLQEEVSGFTDAEIGAAARVVHEGCTRGLSDILELSTVRTEAEGAAVELPPGFDAARTRVTGNVVGEPPFRGTLAHHGWQAKNVRLPARAEGHDPSILAPAEVEL